MFNSYKVLLTSRSMFTIKSRVVHISVRSDFCFTTYFHLTCNCIATLSWNR